MTFQNYIMGLASPGGFLANATEYAVTFLTYSSATIPIGTIVTLGGNVPPSTYTYEGYFLDNGVEYPLVVSGIAFLLGETKTMADYVITPGAYMIPCYCTGTLILTNRGETPVQDLRIHDTVVTASGQHRHIKWLGHRSYAGRFLAANPNVQPIRFRAGSLGPAVPRRDLLVSPEHAMFLDGLLIPARCLVNDSTIVRDRVEQVDYFHVELDSHDVLLAEGAPSESYLDDDSRGMFHNAAEFAVLYPHATDAGRFCAPKVDEGYQLEAIRQRLAVVAEEMAQAA